MYLRHSKRVLPRFDFRELHLHFVHTKEASHKFLYALKLPQSAWRFDWFWGSSVTDRLREGATILQ